MKIKDTIFDTSVCVLLSENRPLPPLPQPPVLQSDEKKTFVMDLCHVVRFYRVSYKLQILHYCIPENSNSTT